ncbi:hypothetical protein AOZ06_37410 [Kibdelosporangium phytohabitans]|uniref:AB hydrolase-1 domain-containing protein n=2 Tax=Kibdelosporangium phytohabitans TaxID=860235 RepID=A0A0N9I8T0_9PSEU|nr:hypothetical protein AOZ06_37410 [Kibdelosporangium phytohabitans]
MAAAAVGFPAVPAQAATPCRDVAFPVTHLGLPQTMYGKLCQPADAKAVQVLVPGASYNSAYWDIEVTPEIRSFRQAMNKAGYATLTLDRLGSGRSTRPLSATLTSFTQANVVHQVIQAVRAGKGVPKFDKVVLGGHSVGSAISVIEAGTYKDVDAVLVTGMMHSVNALGSLPVLASLAPANLDPKFLGKILDPGYLTTRPGLRFSDFHKPGAQAPGVAEHDERTKDVFAPGEFVDTLLLGAILPYSRKIDVPVLLVMGNDPAFCGFLAADCSSAASLLRHESPNYSPAAKLKTYLVGDYGHSINYAPGAPKYHEAVIRWADAAVGR